tara:strand:+ start:2398 stop:2775 length:378 start_codon:yes stop_codon:yes gene_type:complete
MSDNLREHLQAQYIPEPSPKAIDAILHAARQEPPGLFDWLAPLKRARAFVYLPPVRYGVMASVLVVLVGLGMLREEPSLQAPSSQTSQVAQVEEQETPELYYYDQALEEQDNPFEDFLITASFGG